VVFGHGAASAGSEALWIVAHALRVHFDELLDAPSRPVGPAAARRIEAILDRRIGERRPLAYLLREAWLGDLRFYVDERTIVPRSFIAELLPGRLAPWVGTRPIRRILDLCTGSGCLAILAALAFPKATVDAVELSTEALRVAQRNRRSYDLDRRIALIEGDLYVPIAGRRYDLILSNPPYVTASAMRALPSEYRHEPHLALAGGRDGLDLVRRIIGEAPSHLTRRGLMLIEIGHNRRAFERSFPGLHPVWPALAAATDQLVLLQAEDIQAHATALQAGPRGRLRDAGRADPAPVPRHRPPKAPTRRVPR
jgi:ribosomal protein L3 glutamine methyltransferase